MKTTDFEMGTFRRFRNVDQNYCNLILILKGYTCNELSQACETC